MKKLICTLMITTMLFGCSSADTENSSITEENKIETKESITETKDEEKMYVDEDTVIIYETQEEFRNSDFYNKIKNEGFTPYLLEFDEERYEFNNIRADKSWYDFYLYDIQTSKNVCISTIYNSGIKTMSELQETFGNEDDIVTTAEINGQTHDVLLSQRPYVDYVEYSLFYLLEEEYLISINVDNATSDEILEYFDDFELVADNG
ncbi:MAG: hypothetical protein E7500_05055 [Ruminococcus sp.]|nr:hypothetical protein [Ruminococcus sp.]